MSRYLVAMAILASSPAMAFPVVHSVVISTNATIAAARARCRRIPPEQRSERCRRLVGG